MSITNPFPGLRPFEADESHLFFGREDATNELLRKLRNTRFIAVVGTSGSGKSSLVRAGMLPDLYGGYMASVGSQWRVAIMRPGDVPIHALAKALSVPDVFGSALDERGLQTAITETVLRRGALGLVEVARHARMAREESLLIVVDQFEELFRFKDPATGAMIDDEAAAFVKLLLEAARQEAVPIYVVITMRSEYLGDCTMFRDLPEAINAGQFLIPRMTRDQRRSAITGPVAVSSAEMTPPLIHRLLNDVGENPDQLPILQHAMMRTWKYWQSHKDPGRPIDLADYEATGGMAEALSRHADEAFKELDAADREFAERIFKRLTGRGNDNREMRFPTRLGELCNVTGAEIDRVRRVIDVFRSEERSFLLPPVRIPLTRDSLIDISHESLIRIWRRLNQWVDEEALSARIYRRLADTANLFDAGQAALWRDPDLHIALSWRRRASPNPQWAERYFSGGFAAAMSFLDRSRRADRRRRFLKRAPLVIVPLLVVGYAGQRFVAHQKERLQVVRAELKQEKKVKRVLQAEVAEARQQANEAVAELNNLETEKQEKLTEQIVEVATELNEVKAKQQVLEKLETTQDPAQRQVSTDAPKEKIEQEFMVAITEIKTTQAKQEQRLQEKLKKVSAELIELTSDNAPTSKPDARNLSDSVQIEEPPIEDKGPPLGAPMPAVAEDLEQHDPKHGDSVPAALDPEIELSGPEPAELESSSLNSAGADTTPSTDEPSITSKKQTSEETEASNNDPMSATETPHAEASSSDKMPMSQSAATAQPADPESTPDLAALESVEQNGLLTVSQRLSQWEDFLAQAHPEERDKAQSMVDRLRDIVSRSATIESETDFVTCERVERLKPISISGAFEPGRVYVFARVRAPRTEVLKLKWINPLGKEFASRKLEVKPNIGRGYRTYVWKTVATPGIYEVRLYNEGDELIGRREFEVADSETG